MVWDEAFAQYKQGELEPCPATTGQEREEWQLRRLYFACRQLIETIDSDEKPEVVAKAAASVGIATRMPGGAAFDGVFREAMGQMWFRAGNNAGRKDTPAYSEQDLTEFELTIMGKFQQVGSKPMTFAATEHLDFSARKAKRELK